jgi:pantoate kinase
LPPCGSGLGTSGAVALSDGATLGEIVGTALGAEDGSTLGAGAAAEMLGPGGVAIAALVAAGAGLTWP